ncbi:HI1506-related protein [Pseudomonas sp. MRSN 12121]|uniref:HI1506-related protein n=1 Tax=Pseudomonas sp. MRSN 12121 TaxID=1611770 RepID=UPI0005BECFBA|nr:HI1506-related protein [Pseudomonas sp. MRSN 12121]AJO77488.1 hypothetical protein TO66_09310 [Pseudomonas sp. MRSN 12121]
MATVVTIISKRNGFRRCGVAHSDQPKDWPEDAFTDKQWDALFAEPQLILAVKEDGLDLVSEQRYESTSTISGPLPEAPDIPQAAQPQTLEAGTAPMGSALGEICRQILDSEQPGPDDHGANDLDQVERDGQATDLAQASADADQVDEQAQDTAETPAKPAKTRAVKPKDDAK